MGDIGSCWVDLRGLGSGDIENISKASKEVGIVIELNEIEVTRERSNGGSVLYTKIRSGSVIPITPINVLTKEFKLKINEKSGCQEGRKYENEKGETVSIPLELSVDFWGEGGLSAGTTTLKGQALTLDA